MANSYHNLGIIAGEQKDFESAEKCYYKSLKIYEKQGNEHSAATTCHQLGIIAQEQRDFESAENLFRKSIKIKERYNNIYETANSYRQLGILADLQNDELKSGKYFIKAIKICYTCNDQNKLKNIAEDFIVTYQKASTKIQEQLKLCWQDNNIGKFPMDEPELLLKIGKRYTHSGRWNNALFVLGEASNRFKADSKLSAHADAIYQIANVHHLIGNLTTARTHYRDAIRIFKHLKNNKKAAMCKADLGRLMIQTGNFDKALSELNESINFFNKQGDTHFIKLVNENIHAANIFKKNSRKVYHEHY
ncbi:hypothetical protein GMMP1_780001 [Candidatus Magnetomoraceae bacterium gMMP-1]